MLFPNLPSVLGPHPHKVPSVLTAVQCTLPTSTCFQLVPPANVVTGVRLWVVVLFPNLPKVLYPQDHKVPSVFTAAVWVARTLTCFQLVPPANVVTGVDLLIKSLVPILPLLSAAPQDHKVPSVLIAAV